MNSETPATETSSAENTAFERAEEGTAYETSVPADASVVECPDCGRPLRDRERLVLHRGLDHWERLDDGEREAFRDAYRSENEDLRLFRLKMLGLLVLLYFAFLFVYSYFTDDPLSASLFVVGWIPARDRA
ncbi:MULTISPECIES: C2H2-type zinc finger protein [Halorussus]|uniref:C2H2-type zinc finger protein n=1 Tax=Halorussus TaxID=1070314 RepID=UPI0020A123A0|nr:C2H2-type zinc finger protein [Halorussus vallis]USZ75620.1 C2H2-type zinc finger protein [Halorussus vallis]